MLMKHLAGVLGVALLLISPAAAETPSAFPTFDALQAATIPPRDRVELAQQLLGVGDIPAPPAAAPVWALGDSKSFFVTNAADDYTFEVEAALRVSGEHIHFWVQTGAQVNIGVLEELAAVFDRDIYHQMRDLWGSEATPGIDGDPRLYGLFAHGMGPTIAAYFSSTNTYPQAVVPNSNEHEMFFFNLDTIGGLTSVNALAGLVAHEFQHMIRENQSMNEATWLDEGFSTFSELYVGYPYGTFGQAASFLSAPGTQLNTWSEDGPRLPHYGAALLFVTYFYDRYGADGLRRLSADPDTGMAAVENTLRDLGEPDSAAFFADWALANHLQDTSLGDGRYGYTSIDGLNSASARQVVVSYPHLLAATVSQYAADYIILTNLGDAQALNVTFAMPSTVRLIPVDAYSGAWMWYSNRRDDSHTTLTRAFDLTGVDSATLNYRLWYHIEALWDYGYVMVSDNDGASWTPLAAPGTTTENPHENAYGPGYTGRSDGWVAESVSLDEYAGREILVRFAVITDEAVVQPGMAIDDVAIPEIGYFSDFEADAGGWLAEGWVRIDNVLPQQAWVQAVQHTPDEVAIARWQAPADSVWTLPLIDEVSQVVLVISPYAALTTVPMQYTLNITLD